VKKVSKNKKQSEEAVQKLQAAKEKAAALILQNFKQQQVVPQPEDKRLKDFTEELDKRLTPLEQYAQQRLKNPQTPTPQAPAIIIFKGKGKKPEKQISNMAEDAAELTK
jgi:hypothetical protein